MPRERVTAETRRSRRTARKYGWLPDIPDHRDHTHAPPRSVLRPVLSRVDLRPMSPPVCHLAVSRVAPRMRSRPSRLFIYYNESVLEQTAEHDAGGMIRNGIKGVADL